MKHTRFAAESKAQATRRKLIGQDELRAAIDSFGVMTVLEMIAEVCWTKATEQQNSVLPDSGAVKRWRKFAARIEQAAETINCV